jgi:hypothetical protein
METIACRIGDCVANGAASVVIAAKNADNVSSNDTILGVVLGIDLI